MQNSDFNNNDEIINSMTESLLNNQFDESPQSLNQEEMSTNIQDNQITKEDKIGKIEFPKSMKTTKIQKNLDDYIQNCLNKYKPVEKPDPSLYQNTTEQERDFIISRKSTIPDLVIWNKTFNKNECFYEANTDIQNDFPRYRFYLRLGNKDKSGKNKNEKNKNEKKKNKKKNKNKNNNVNNGDGTRRGEVKYVGKCKELGHGYFVGILLDEPFGDTNGCIKGVKYFEAPDNYGIMVRPNYVKVGDYPPIDEFNAKEDEI